MGQGYQFHLSQQLAVPTWMSEWMNEWMNGWIKEWIIFIIF